MEEDNFLPTAMPEELGIPSASILEFINCMEAREIPMHSLLIIKDNRLAYEGYWAPYTKDSLQRMYSVTKSFVSLAIGMLIDDKQITLQDNIVDYFPEYITKDSHDYIKNATICDLLRMASIHEETTYKLFGSDLDTKDWIATYFQTGPNHPGGSYFNYDTSATTVLCALIERLSEKPLLDFMREKALHAIGFSEEAFCIKTPCGYSWGGSGLLCTSRDLARVALLVLNEGKYKENQLISKEYIKQATASQIDDRIAERRDGLGYGYQFWRIEGNGFAFLGMGSQLALCYPEKNMLVVITADTQEFAGESKNIIRAVDERLCSQVQQKPLSYNKTEYERLEKYTRELKLLPMKGNKDSPIMEQISDKIYKMKENALGFETLMFRFTQQKGILKYTTTRGAHEIQFGLGENVFGEFPETHYYKEQIGVSGGLAYHCASSAAWFDASSLVLYCYIIDDCLGLLKMQFFFDKETITIRSKKHAEWFLEEYVGIALGKQQ